jgi:hypothetical protein
MRSLKSWFVKKKSPPDRRGAERVLSPWLVAYEWSGSEPKKHDIRDISTTGVYLLTEERWRPGELVSIGLQRKDRPDQNPERGIAIQVKAIRWGKDGVGLSFVEARDLDLGVGDGRLTNGTDRKEPEDVRRRFRMAKASAFVDRICFSISEDVRTLFGKRLSTVRVGNAIEIALKAECMLGSGPDAERKRAHPQIVTRILEDGSWTDEEPIQQLWAGLLVASCTDEGEDESNLGLITLLSELATDHIRIFAAACARATVVKSESGSISAQPLFCTMEELMKITGLQHQFYRIEVDIGHLTVFGLLKDRVKCSTYTSSSEAEVTPTVLGLELYARCHGHRGAPRDFYLGTSRQMPRGGKEPSAQASEEAAQTRS